MSFYLCTITVTFVSIPCVSIQCVYQCEVQYEKKKKMTMTRDTIDHHRITTRLSKTILCKKILAFNFYGNGVHGGSIQSTILTYDCCFPYSIKVDKANLCSRNINKLKIQNQIQQTIALLVSHQSALMPRYPYY